MEPFFRISMASVKGRNREDLYSVFYEGKKENCSSAAFYSWFDVVRSRAVRLDMPWLSDCFLGQVGVDYFHSHFLLAVSQLFVIASSTPLEFSHLLDVFSHLLCCLSGFDLELIRC